MSLDHLKDDLETHLAKRPVQPCPIAQMTQKQYTEWSSALGEWANKLDAIRSLAIGIIGLAPIPRQPAVTPRSDYYYRGKMPRKRKTA